MRNRINRTIMYFVPLASVAGLSCEQPFPESALVGFNPISPGDYPGSTCSSRAFDVDTELAENNFDYASRRAGEMFDSFTQGITSSMRGVEGGTTFMNGVLEKSGNSTRELIIDATRIGNIVDIDLRRSPGSGDGQFLGVRLKKNGQSSQGKCDFFFHNNFSPVLGAMLKDFVTLEMTGDCVAPQEKMHLVFHSNGIWSEMEREVIEQQISNAGGKDQFLLSLTPVQMQSLQHNSLYGELFADIDLTTSVETSTPGATAEATTQEPRSTTPMSTSRAERGAAVGSATALLATASMAASYHSR